MPLHHRILELAYPPVKWTKDIGRRLGLVSPHALRVLLYHDIAPNDKTRFAEQLRWLARTWTFIAPERFAAMLAGEEPVQGRNLLLTFDDGFASNRVIAEEILNPVGIRALFFVTSDFVAITECAEARQFISQNIFGTGRLDDLPGHMRNMGWTDLEALLEQGHCLGSHTRTHARLSNLNGLSLENEIIGSGDMLAHRLGVSVEHFAYTFGDIASFSNEALSIARQRYRFIYSGLRGDNAGGVSKFAVRRDAAATQDFRLNYSILPNELVGAFLEGAADIHYARSRANLDAWNLGGC